MARRRHGGDAHVADPQHVAVVELEIDKWGGAEMAHHHLCAKRMCDLARAREVIGMGVRVDGVANGQAMARGEAAIALDRR